MHSGKIKTILQGYLNKE